jgi:hypothetical protein
MAEFGRKQGIRPRQISLCGSVQKDHNSGVVHILVHVVLYVQLILTIPEANSYTLNDLFIRLNQELACISLGPRANKLRKAELITRIICPVGF